jgi:uncharacterized damage-inducible protein DinB
MAQTTPTSSSTSATTSPSAKARFLDVYQREHATTMKVLRAFPPEQSDFRPHEVCNTARQLAWTLVAGERLMHIALKNERVLGSGFPPAPESWNAILDAFATQHEQIMRRLEEASDAELNGTVQFYTGPKQLGDFPTMEFVWFMLYDQIHHRGQLSVYLRMAGGKVPSIYGPSADEPWF